MSALSGVAPSAQDLLEKVPAPPLALRSFGRRFIHRPIRSARWPLLTAGGTLLTVALVYAWWNHTQAYVRTDNAFVTGTIHVIGSRVGGTVEKVFVTDNQPVSPGCPLFQLDARDYKLQVRQAQSELDQVAARIAQTDAQVLQGQAQRDQAAARLAKASAELERARLDFERAKSLTESTNFAAISKQEFDAAKTAYDVATASLAVAHADLKSAQGALQSAEANRVLVEAMRTTAQTKLEQAELECSYTLIRAPVAGRLGRKSAEVGQRVQPGQAMVALVGEDKWVVANFKETQLARLRVGQPVTIRIDASPGRSFQGRIESFSPASGSQFALLPPDNATGNFTKIVQRVPVKIVFDAGSTAALRDRLAPGTSAVVDVRLTP